MAERDRPVALVTGAAKRLGATIVARLAASGADVIVHHRSSADEAAAVVKAARDAGAAAWSVQADLADAAAPERVVDEAARLAGRPVTWLVNNASAFPERTLAEATAEDFDALTRLHVWAPLAATRAVAAQGAEAAVVNMLDTRVTSFDPGHVPYLVTKQALWHLTATLAKELAPRVRVNGVAPGAALPPPGKSDEHLDAFVGAAPLGRLPSPDDIADAVAYLLTAQSVTGQTIFVDGGRHLG